MFGSRRIVDDCRKPAAYDAPVRRYVAVCFETTTLLK